MPCNGVTEQWDNVSWSDWSFRRSPIRAFEFTCVEGANFDVQYENIGHSLNCVCPFLCVRVCVRVCMCISFRSLYFICVEARDKNAFITSEKITRRATQV